MVALHNSVYRSGIIAGGTVVSSIFSERIIGRFGTGIVTTVSVLMTAIALIGFSVQYLGFIVWNIANKAESRVFVVGSSKTSGWTDSDLT